MVKAQCIAGWGLQVPQELGGEQREITPFRVCCVDPSCPWDRRMAYKPRLDVIEFFPLPKVRDEEGHLVSHDPPAYDYEWTPEEGEELFELGRYIEGQKFVGYYLLRRPTGSIYLRYIAARQHFHAKVEIIDREELPEDLEKQS